MLQLALAEKSPIVVISGTPGIKWIHFFIIRFGTQQKIFEHMTIDSVLIGNLRTAAKNIDRVLSSATRYKSPVYIELPRDQTSIPIYQEWYSETPWYNRSWKRFCGTGLEPTVCFCHYDWLYLVSLQHFCNTQKINPTQIVVLNCFTLFFPVNPEWNSFTLVMLVPISSSSQLASQGILVHPCVARYNLVLYLG